MKLLIISGSRADYGMLEWPTKVLNEDSFFSVDTLKIWGQHLDEAWRTVADYLVGYRPDMVMLLGDRFEIMAAAMACHLQRVPIAHLCGGDISEGSYDDAMRDCISRMATLHFTTSEQSANRLLEIGCKRVYMVGSTGIDYIRNAPWRELGIPAIAKPYVLVAYYPETIDDTVDLEAVNKAINGRGAFWITPNPDRGADRIPAAWTFEHDQFLSVMANCDEFIGNSSAILYEAPELGVKTKLIGKRQRGRVVPWGDGHASERIRDILKTWQPS